MSEVVETEVIQSEEAISLEAPRIRSRGAFVGKPTTSDLVKRMWQSQSKGVSLKSFARELAKSGDKLMQDWLAHKKGSLDLKRSDKNVSEAQLAAQATKAAKRKLKK